MARKNNTAAVVVETPVVEAPKKVYPTIEQMEADGLTTKSAKIRHLHSLDMPTGEIARTLGIIYQHAFNVIKKPLKRPVAEAAEPKTEEPATESETPNTEEA